MSIEFKLSARIKRPPETVFAIATDLPKMGQWAGKAIHNISPGPVVVGSSFTLINEFMGADQKTNYRVTICEPGRRFAYQGSGIGSNLVDMNFSPDPLGTQVTTMISLQLKGLVATVAKGTVRDMAQNSLVRFVKLCESTKA